jgi:hypothetical protein
VKKRYYQRSHCWDVMFSEFHLPYPTYCHIQVPYGKGARVYQHLTFDNAIAEVRRHLVASHRNGYMSTKVFNQEMKRLETFEKAHHVKPEDLGEEGVTFDG